MNALKDTISVRQGEELNSINLLNFLKNHNLELPDAELQIEQFPSGHSNLTYLLKIGRWEAVLRRPPLGPVAPKAHDMEREFNILTELQDIFPIAPRPYLYSNDLNIIGSPFFLMERKKGIVLDTEFPSTLTISSELFKGISEKMVDILVELHSIDYHNTRLVEWSKPEGFMKRQVSGWIQRYERAKTDDIPLVEWLQKWLIDNIPPTSSACIIHYDFKLNNIMYSQDLSQIVGLFDWEMTTVGDPLADLGAAMSYWIQADDPDLLQKGFGKPPLTVYEGFLSRKGFIELYAQKSGRDVTNINFYLVFAYFKLAVICQQIHFRYKKGQTNDLRFKKFNHTVKSLIEYAVINIKEKL